jgi:thioredoxin-related protein
MPVLIMVFSPDCEHCRHHAEEIVKNKEAFENIQIIMATMLPFSKMKDFFSAYKLDKIPNVIVGQDREFILSTFYKMKSLPFLAFYNKKGKLIDVFEGSLPVNKILEVFKK